MDNELDVSGSCTPCQDPASHSSHHKICYICQESTGILVQQPQHDSYERFLQSVKSRALYGDHKYISISDRLGDTTINELIKNQVTWHRECYSTAVHKVHIERQKHRYENALKAGDAPKPAKVGRPVDRQVITPQPDEHPAIPA